MSIIKFGSTALNGTNKAGTLKPDADGYYEMIVGGLNIFNSAGQYYCLEGAKDLFMESSQFQRRIKRGALKGEVSHPKQEKGMSFDDYVGRILEIRESNVCVHFSEIWLDFNKVKDNNGKAVVAIMAKLIPSGPHGPMLQKSLDNPKENVCFSIRSFTRDFYDRGVQIRELKNIVTFDFVLECGISIANKYQAPSLEGLSDNIITKQQLQRICKDPVVMGVGTESANLVSNEVLDSLGWSFSAGTKVAFTKW